MAPTLQAQTQPQSASRPRRPRPSKSASSNPQDPTSDQQDSTASAAGTPGKIRRRRGNTKTQAREIPVVAQEVAPPLTPPRSAQSIQGYQNDGPASPILIAQKSARKKQQRPKPNCDQADSSASGSGLRSPQPVPFSTPGKANAQFYAGPTFHASPAPTSLPIPRFFSKSLPAIDSKTVLSNPLAADGGVSEESSDELASSPSFKSALRASEAMASQPSPLDIFFKADRDEKARLLSATASHDQIRARSVSPLADGHRSESTSSHTNGVFAMDPEPFSGRSTFQVPQLSHDHRTESSPSILMHHKDGSETDVRAKTEALKQLLFNPTPQRSPLASPGLPPSPSNPPSRPPYSARKSNPYPNSPMGTVNSPNARSRPLSTQNPHGFKDIPLQPSGSSGRRPAANRAPYSGLRQEVLSDNPDDVSDGPRTPTPASRSHNVSALGTPTSLFGDRSTNRSVGPPSRPLSGRFQPEDALQATMRSSSASTSDMETQLRQILNIGTLGAGQVRS